tara:strand:- start:8464 stop:8745 length:282 start_codon:yes stop_codon:yes gene_type:complete
MTNKLNLIRKDKAQATYACGKTLFQQKINEGLVPPPIKLGLRAVAFYEQEINATLAVTIAGYTDEQIKEFVKGLVAKRKNLLAQYTHLEAAND